MPKGVYERTEANKPKPRAYPPEIVELVRRLYLLDGLTVREVQEKLPRGYKAQRIIERYVPQRRRQGPLVQRGDSNNNWVGDSACYAAVHRRLQSQRGRASEHRCVDCGNAAHEWSYRGGAPSEIPRADRTPAYCTDLTYYEPRCRSCHRSLDYSMGAWNG